MGNIIITVSWRPNTNDVMIKDRLRALAIHHNLSTDNGEGMGYRDYTGKTTFNADISGLRLAFNYDKQKLKVEQYGQECIVLLDLLNVTDPQFHIDQLAL